MSGNGDSSPDANRSERSCLGAEKISVFMSWSCFGGVMDWACTVLLQAWVSSEEHTGKESVSVQELSDGCACGMPGSTQVSSQGVCRSSVIPVHAE